MKLPDDPVPSGDREMARLLVAALELGGHRVEVASRLRTRVARPDPDAMRAVETAADGETRRLTRAWHASGPPEAVFCYHSYYKAPDLLGPRLSAAFGLPYLVAEASHASSRAGGPWAPWHAANEAAVRAASLHLAFTPRDAEGLGGLVPRARILMLPPFLDPGPFANAPSRRSATEGPVRLVTVAMMRAGDKLRSYEALAATLSALPRGLAWSLAIVGDGPERGRVEALFGALPAGRVAWHGTLAPEAVAAVLAASDLYVWPGYGEAFGVSYLEAQASGLPVLAMRCGGVATVVDDGRTGVLTPEGDRDAYAAALAGLIADPTRRRWLGEAGRRFVLQERTVEGAATRLSDALRLARVLGPPA